MSPRFIYVKGNDLTEKQLESLVDLFLTTSYYEFCAMENKLKLPVREFNKSTVCDSTVSNDNYNGKQ